MYNETMLSTISPHPALLLAGYVGYAAATSGRAPSMNTAKPMKICACLGLLTDEQARELKAAGVDRYNHNLNTSADHYDRITTTHGYEDRVRTVEAVKGISFDIPVNSTVALVG